MKNTTLKSKLRKLKLLTEKIKNILVHFKAKFFKMKQFDTIRKKRIYFLFRKIY